MTLTVGSLFSGIGGLDLGLERAGMTVIWQSEIDDFACRVLKKHWPTVPNLGNIKEIDWSTVERPDIICGGYPCQPFSTAGRRKGKEDERHLWPWVLESISRLRPRYAILENVRGHLSLGGLSVIGELAAVGYRSEWRIVSAASVGANHRRERIIIVAYPESQSSNGLHDYSGNSERPETSTELGNSSWPTPMANATSSGLQRELGEVFEGGGGRLAYGGWEWWKVEPDVGRMANGVPSRVDRLRGLGNAVVPQVAEVIGKLVVAHAERI